MNNINYINEDVKIKTKENKNCLILNIISIVVFGLSTIVGINSLIEGNIDASQSSLMIIESLLGLIIPLAYVVLHKLFNIKVGFSLQLCIFIFAFMGIVLGETFHFYYLIPFWDKILHTASGFGITFIGFSLCYGYIKDKALDHKIAIALIVGFLFSLAFSVLWEFYEFTVDSVFGLNMQKSMPTNELFNGGSTNSLLIGSSEQIADFYRSPAGYRYALMDTMTDLLLNGLGTIIMITIIGLVSKYSTNDLFSNAITYEKKGTTM